MFVTLALLNFGRFSDASTIASFLSVLAEMGIDLTQPCDPMGYGSPAFWAAKKGRDECLLELFNLGVDLTAVCEKHGKNTFEIASITGNQRAIERVKAQQARRALAAKKAQAMMRGVLARRRATKVKVRVVAMRRIQALVRGEQVRIGHPLGEGRKWRKRQVGVRLKCRQSASIQIQALLRGFLVRIHM